MKANPYDWMKQGREHRAFGARYYPLMAGLAAKSNGYPAFAMQVQGLSGVQKQQYVTEWKQWYGRHGKSWDKLGCIKETRLGQYTDKYRWTEWEPGLGALGATAIVPPPPPMPSSGWSAMADPGSNFIPTTDVISIPNYPGWVRQIGGLKYDQLEPGKFPWALVYARTDGSEYRWYYKYSANQPGFPTIGGGVEPSPPLNQDAKQAVMALQQALNNANAKGADGKALTVDGKVGPNTCFAAYQFKQEMGMGVDSSLPKSFWQFLGLPSTYSQYFKLCEPYHQTGGPSKYSPQPGPVSPGLGPSSPPTAPVEQSISKAGFDPKLVVVGGLLLLGGAYLASRRKKKRAKGRK